MLTDKCPQQRAAPPASPAQPLWPLITALLILTDLDQIRMDQNGSEGSHCTLENSERGGLGTRPKSPAA